MNYYSIPPLLTALLIFSVGAFVLYKNHQSRINQVFSLICLSLVWWLFSYTGVYLSKDPGSALTWARIGLLGIIFIPILTYHFAITFLGLRRRKTLRGLYIGAVPLLFLSQTGLIYKDVDFHFWGFYPTAGPLYIFFIALYAGLFLRVLVLLYQGMKEKKESRDALRYEQIKFVLLSFGIGTLGLIDYVVKMGFEFYPFGYVIAGIFILLNGYAIIRYRLMDITTVVHKTAIWAAMSSLIILPVGFLFYLGFEWVHRLGPLGISLLVAGVVFLMIPYAKTVQPRIDHLFQRRKYDLQKILKDFIHEIAALKGLDDLVDKLRTTISAVLYPENNSIILFDFQSHKLTPGLSLGLPEGFSVKGHRVFLDWLEKENAVIELDLISADPRFRAVKSAAEVYFDSVNGKIAVPLIHDGKLLAVINLGQKKNLKPYSSLEIQFLSDLRVEASIAFTNSLLYDDVSRMSRELQGAAEGLEQKVDERTRELAESKYEIERAYEKLKELDAIKTQFFSNVSHELRTPLTLVLAPLESLFKGEFGEISEDQKSHVGVMHQNALRLLKMINNLLELARMDSGRVGLNLAEADLGDFVEGVVASMQPMAEKKKISLSFEKEEAVYSIVCDKEKIERVILNLIFNSLKFTDPSGEVSVRLGLINRKENGFRERDVLISVKDNGIGIPKESQSEIFERFSQVDASSSRKYEGTGIGLALARELVELHGGKIRVESEPAEGTCMTFNIPTNLQVPSEIPKIENEESRRWKLKDRRSAERRREEDWTKTLHAEAEYAQGGFPSPSGHSSGVPPGPLDPALPTVLLVEDNTDMRNFIAYQLKKDFNLVQASDGLEGSKMAADLVPEVIITDVMMPGKDGYQLCKEIKSNPRTRHIPVVLLTAKAGMEEKIAALEIGADDFLGKPFNAGELKAKIHSLVQLRKLEREIQSRNEELEKVLFDLKETQSQLVHSEKMASLGLLVSGIAHEVNNPVSFAKGSLSNLRKYYARLKDSLGAYPEKANPGPPSLKLLKDMETAIQIIQTGLERTEGIVTDLKTFARKNDKTFKRVNLEDGLKATGKLLRTEMGGRIDFQADYGIGEEVEVIPGQINQVFMNLMQNAIHAIPDTGTIRVRTWKDSTHVYISVRDDGMGIKKEDRGRIFEPFFTTKPAGKGTGLGLSVSYRIVENHGGTIVAHSEEGRGAEFEVTLPKRQTPDRSKTSLPMESLASNKGAGNT